jgi:thiaminase
MITNSRSKINDNSPHDKLANMMNSKEDSFIGDMTRKFSSLADKILHHAYLLNIENNKLNKEDLKVFVCEQYQIISNDKRNFEVAASRASNSSLKSVSLFQDCISFESSALCDLDFLANDLSLTNANLKSYEPLAGCQAYTNYLTRLCSYGSDAEILVALLIDLPVWGRNCKRISNALRSKYGFTEESCRFLDRFSAPLQEEFLKKSTEVIESGPPILLREMENAARLILDYELMFWDSLYKYSFKT